MPHKDPEVSRAYHQGYYLEHKQEKRAYKRAHALKNKETISAYQQDYRANHKQERAAYQHAYYLAHKEEHAAYKRAYNLARKSAIAARDRAYRLAHPEIGAAHTHRRRAQKRQAPFNDLTAAQWLEIQIAQDHRCHYCGKRCKGRLSQDHITPLSKGGSHTLHNVIGACYTCNSKKHTGPPPVPVQPLLLTIAPARKKKVS